jgi:hypothetical protein
MVTMVRTYILLPPNNEYCRKSWYLHLSGERDYEAPLVVTVVTTLPSRQRASEVPPVILEERRLRRVPGDRT